MSPRQPNGSLRVKTRPLFALLVRRLKREGYWVRGVDIKRPEFSPSAADEFHVLDLREEKNCRAAIQLDLGFADEVYQLAADMGAWPWLMAVATGRQSG